MNADEAAPEAGARLVRVRLDLSYDGTDFAGWAPQPGQRTVAGVLTEALSVLIPTSLGLTVAGRTDAGVHALGQVAHLDLPPRGLPEIQRLHAQLSGLLPADVRVREIREVSPDFDARFSALWRRYGYRISDAGWGVQPLRRVDTLHWRRRLDEAAMQRAGNALLGTHDFAAYCRRRERATTIRELQKLSLERTGEVVEVRVQADAFCHSMVRSIVGALLAVGDGRRPPDWPASLLSSPHRANDVQVSPPNGLTLLEVGYPPGDQLAARAHVTRSTRQAGSSAYPS